MKEFPVSRSMIPALVALLLSVAAVFEPLPAHAEDIQFAKRIVGELTSPRYWGRGYTKDGMKNAAGFIAGELSSYGLLPLGGDSYAQNFEMSVNTFPGAMNVILNGKRLRPGEDFIIATQSSGVKMTSELVAHDEAGYSDPTERVLLTVKEKLTWSVRQKLLPTTEVQIDRAVLKDLPGGVPKEISIDVENQFIENFQAANLCAFVKGTSTPDSFVVFSAHYDHLGGMGGETFFPGANDNASGVSLVLALAKYYAKNPPTHSVAFLFFAAEEAGLVGSKYFVENPRVDLKKIRFVMNFDLVGTGDTGATVVNSTEFPAEFDMLQAANREGSFLTKIYPRGKAPNSDHYWFSERGVPAFFLYTMGGIAAYHDIHDRAETLPLNKFEDVFHLAQKFANRLMQ